MSNKIFTIHRKKLETYWVSDREPRPGAAAVAQHVELKNFKKPIQVLKFGDRWSVHPTSENVFRAQLAVGKTYFRCLEYSGPEDEFTREAKSYDERAARRREQQPLRTLPTLYDDEYDDDDEYPPPGQEEVPL